MHQLSHTFCRPDVDRSPWHGNKTTKTTATTTTTILFPDGDPHLEGLVVQNVSAYDAAHPKIADVMCLGVGLGIVEPSCKRRQHL